MIEDDLKSYNGSHLMTYAMLLMGMSRDQVDQDVAAMALRSRSDVGRECGLLQPLALEKLSF